MPGFVYIDGSNITLTFGDTQTSFNAAANATVNFTQAIGAAAADRYVAVALSMNIDASQSVTVAGQACTRVAQIVSGLFFNEIWITNAPVTSGTTATVALAGAHIANPRICSSTFALYGLTSPTPKATGSDATPSLDIALSLDAGEAAIGVSVTNGLVTSTWSSFTEEVDIQNSPITHTAAHRTTPGSFTETVTPSGGTSSLFLAAVWS